MRIKPMAFGILAIALFFGTVAVAMTTGAWQTTGRGSVATGVGTGSDQEMPAVIDSSIDIKGWMAVGDVATATGIDLAELLAAFGLPPETPPETALKDLESGTFSVPAVRDWLDARAAGAVDASPGASAAP